MIDLEKLEIIQKPLKDDHKLLYFPRVHKLYNLSLEKLKFNPYNDRFAVEITEYERENNSRLGFDEQSQKYLSNLLTNENPEKKQTTKRDILKRGLQNPIVIESRGIVIDGNRRLMILRDIVNDGDLKFEEKRLFTNVKVVLLDEDDNMTESRIREIETLLNTAVDSPLGYTPINTYFKIFKLFQNEKGTNDFLKYSQVADKMGTKYKNLTVKEHLSTFKEMKRYLDFMRCPDQYTLLKLRDDHFKTVNKFKKNLKIDNLGTEYTINDFDVLTKIDKIIYYLISILWEGKKFRAIFPTKNKKTFFSKKANIDFLWKEMQKISLKEYCLKNPSQPLFDSKRKKILEDSIRLLQDESIDVSPEKLIKKMELNTIELKKNWKKTLDFDLQKRLKKIITILTDIKNKDEF